MQGLMAHPLKDAARALQRRTGAAYTTCLTFLVENMDASFREEVAALRNGAPSLDRNDAVARVALPRFRRKFPAKESPP